MDKTRLSLESQQEHVSRDAFRKRLSEYGWMANDLSRDIGHDTFVHICDRNDFSGLTFIVQVKSTSSPRMVAGSGSVAYRFDVCDFEYWEASTPTNVLVLWDVMTDKGWWIGVEDAIGDLDKRLPDWREKGTTTVHFPPTNTLDDGGLKALREVVRLRSMPMIEAGRKVNISMKFSFPPDDAGRAKAREFQKMLDEGDEVQIDGQYISEYTTSLWHRRLLGPGHDRPSGLVIKPMPSEKPLPIRLTVPGREAEGGEIPFVELKMVKGGKIAFLFEGSDPTNLIHVTWKVSDVEGSSFHLQYKQRPTSARFALKTLRFFEAFISARKLTVTPLSIDAPATFDRSFEALPLAPSAIILEQLEKILVIEERYGVSIPLPKRWSFDDEDIGAITEAYIACTEGVVERAGTTITITGDREAAQKWLAIVEDDEPLEHRDTSGLVLTMKRSVQIFGRTVDLGPIRNRSPMTREEFNKAVREGLTRAKKSRDVTVRLRVPSMRTTYERWTTPAITACDPVSLGLSSVGRRSKRRSSSSI